MSNKGIKRDGGEANMRKKKNGRHILKFNMRSGVQNLAIAHTCTLI